MFAGDIGFPYACLALEIPSLVSWLRSTYTNLEIFQHRQSSNVALDEQLNSSIKTC